MKTLVIGANGKIGRLFCQKAAEQGLAVRAILRDPAQRSFFQFLGVETVLGDLERNAAPGARLAFWNMMVDRELQEDSVFSYNIELSEELFSRDKAFFYKRFIVGEKQ